MYEVCVSLGCVTSLAQLLLVYFLILSPVIALISHEQCCFRPCQRCSVWFKDATVRERENQGLWEVDCETETGLAGCKSWPCGRGGGRWQVRWVFGGRAALVRVSGTNERR